MPHRDLEQRVRNVFAGAPTAAAAAVSEVRTYRNHPGSIDSIRAVVGPGGSDEDAVFLFAVRRALLSRWF